MRWFSRSVNDNDKTHKRCNNNYIKCGETEVRFFFLFPTMSSFLGGDQSETKNQKKKLN